MDFYDDQGDCASESGSEDESSVLEFPVKIALEIRDRHTISLLSSTRLDYAQQHHSGLKAARPLIVASWNSFLQGLRDGCHVGSSEQMVVASSQYLHEQERLSRIRSLLLPLPEYLISGFQPLNGRRASGAREPPAHPSSPWRWQIRLNFSRLF